MPSKNKRSKRETAQQQNPNAQTNKRYRIPPFNEFDQHLGQSFRPLYEYLSRHQPEFSRKALDLITQKFNILIKLGHNHKKSFCLHAPTQHNFDTASTSTDKRVECIKGILTAWAGLTQTTDISTDAAIEELKKLLESTKIGDKNHSLLKASFDTSSMADSSTAEATKNGMRTASCVSKMDLPLIKPKTDEQGEYLKTIDNNDITLCNAPAGSGKTYLAIFKALKMLKQGEVSQIILLRPAQDADESLGYLPGDIDDKVGPYLQPLCNATDEILGNGDLNKGERKRRALGNIIKTSAIAFLRGTQFHNAAVVVDEAQNTKVGQMKMILTRIMEGSKLIIVGDTTQVDLPTHEPSGFNYAVEHYSQNPLKGLGICHMTKASIVRHHLIGSILDNWNPPAPRDPRVEREMRVIEALETMAQQFNFAQTFEHNGNGHNGNGNGNGQVHLEQQSRTPALDPSPS